MAATAKVTDTAHTPLGRRWQTALRAMMTAMGKVDYDQRLHEVYAQGRALSPEATATWMAAFSRRAADRRPLAVVDVGSGTGRFTPALADTFGGPVYGVEPSMRMRAVAEEHAAHPAVSYLAGGAEAIPLPEDSCDLALLFLVWHHVSDRVRAVGELETVCCVPRPGF